MAGSELGRHYSDYADSEKRRYLTWTAGLAIAVSVSIALAWFIVSRTPEQPFSANEIGKLALSVPLLAFAAYAGRQATYHRNNETAARQFAVQLRTVKAFTEALDDDGKKEVVLAFGQKLFGLNPSNPELDTQADSAPPSGVSFGAVSELAEVLKKMAQAASGKS